MPDVRYHILPPLVSSLDVTINKRGGHIKMHAFSIFGETVLLFSIGYINGLRK